MTLILDDETVRSVFDWNSAIAALRDAYAAAPDHGRFPARTMARGDHGWLRTLSGVPAGPALMGLKVIAAAPSARRVSYLVPLFDQRSAELVALLDGHSITGYRTAVTTALAADLLAPPDTGGVAVIGSGFEAQNHVRALAAVRDVKSVRVYSPSAASRTRFVAALADVSTTIEPADSAEAAVEGATIVVCAARSRDEIPTLRGTWLRPGTTVLSIGSTLPEQREVDTETVARADLLVADVLAEVLDQTGDLIAARAEGIDAAGKAIALADVVSGRRPGRESRDQLVLYKSVGSAVADLAVAEMCLRAAQRRGLGAQLPLEIQPVEK
jgi:alanine dehydrogenase